VFKKAFWAAGMNLLDLLKNENSALLAPTWRGTWARLWLKPSVFSAQSFVVGVAVFDKAGLSDFRFISDTNKFECIYGESGRFHVDQIISQARQRLSAARENHEAINTATMISGVQIDPVGYISGASASGAMESAMNEAEIPMEPAPEQSKTARFKSRA
jgi:hypothetical protein